ncbi:MAG: hypothetical protein KatS3mg024_1286 [Armatimonadota bacterium]|nr:MAG: hypothetical protein KatS3mg024_1286 [Armatimonadota bacterium]
MARILRKFLYLKTGPFVLALVYVRALSAPAGAGQVLFVNAPLLTNDLGFFSDVRWPEWQAEDFILSGGPAFAVTGAGWWGRYFLLGQAGAVTPEGSGNFVIRFYDMQDANPAQTHFLEIPVGHVPRQQVGVSSNGVPLFRWEVSLSDPILLESDRQYAVSVFNRGGAQGDPVFALLWSAPANWGDPRWRRTSESSPWQRSGYNFAFELRGEVVPEPTGLLILAGGLSVLAKFRRLLDWYR